MLIARVRAEMGHIVRYPHRVCVTADRGAIELSGCIGLDEKPILLETIDRVRGVRQIRDCLVELDWIDLLLDPEIRTAPRAA